MLWIIILLKSMTFCDLRLYDCGLCDDAGITKLIESTKSLEELNVQ